MHLAIRKIVKAATAPVKDKNGETEEAISRNNVNGDMMTLDESSHC